MITTVAIVRETLYSESLVALDLKTGVRKWHYQLVHRDLGFRHSLRAILKDITVNGKLIKAVISH